VICDVVIQIFRGHASETIYERFEALMIRIHVLNVINLFRNIALLLWAHLLMLQLVVAGKLPESFFFIGAKDCARLQPLRQQPIQRRCAELPEFCYFGDRLFCTIPGDKNAYLFFGYAAFRRDAAALAGFSLKIALALLRVQKEGVSSASTIPFNFCDFISERAWRIL